jgi:hypothetical protein
MAFSAQYFLNEAAYEIKKEVWRSNSLPPTFKSSNRNSYAIPFSRHLKISLYKGTTVTKSSICCVAHRFKNLRVKLTARAATGTEA